MTAVTMMNKGQFENAREYAKPVFGGTLSLWIGTEENGAVVREDGIGGRQSFRHFPKVERAREYFKDRQTSRLA